jgi:hypothetical protein
MQRHDPKSTCGSRCFAVGEIKELISRRLGAGHVPRDLRIHRDTTNFLAIDTGEVMLLGGVPYLVRGHEREGRFGLDDDPKFWVKRAVDLLTGETKIVKLSFVEKFSLRIGSTSIECVRSPRKEARILSLVGGDSRFMQGRSVTDAAGNIVRILDYIRGPSLADHVQDFAGDHETYFHVDFPPLLDVFITLAEAIGFLHRRGEKHGDIRRDHVLRERQGGCWRWIDFDYNYHHPVNPYGYDLFGLGNILIYLAGKGDLTPRDLKERSPPLSLQADDMNIIFSNRVADIGKVYPYLPGSIRRILRHFSAGTNVFYESIDVFLEDLAEARESLPPAAGNHQAVREEGDEGKH